ncbi:XRE family transcriptional regulator [Fodinicola acaciae]|uniref:XRE family transcriptional regulator n=1 Tax=Fodinicola acaciae TaxID=2681555 RepID=UPI0013D15299|nr:XRE family transcriptional regulator [Fodinicola acaciae]
MPGYDPIRLPPDFWTDPAVREALRARDIGRLLKIMTSPPLKISQTRIGVAIGGKDQGQISRMINKTKEKTLGSLIDIADGLDMPQSARYDLLHGLLGASPQPDPIPTPDPTVGLIYPAGDQPDRASVAELLRVDLDGHTAVTDAAVNLDAWKTTYMQWLLADTDQAAPADIGRIAGVEGIRRTTELFARLDNQFGGGHARQALVQYLRSDVLPLLDEHHPDPIRAELYRATAEAVLLAAWMSYDAGNHGLAQRYFIQAAKIADSAGDRVLSASILDAMSHQATFIGNYTEAAQLAQAAQAGTRGRATATLTAHFSLMEARALARLGDATGTDRAISKAVTLFEKRRPDDDPEWIRYVDDAELAAEIGHCFRDLDRHQAAAGYLLQSVGGTSDEYLRSNYFATMVLADAHLAAGDREQAQAIALKGIEVGEYLKSARTTTYLREFRARLEASSSTVDTDFVDALSGSNLWRRAEEELRTENR